MSTAWRQGRGEDPSSADATTVGLLPLEGYHVALAAEERPSRDGRPGGAEPHIGATFSETAPQPRFVRSRDRIGMRASVRGGLDADPDGRSALTAVNEFLSSRQLKRAFWDAAAIAPEGRSLGRRHVMGSDGRAALDAHHRLRSRAIAETGLS
jgi:hypothetical protein